MGSNMSSQEASESDDGEMDTLLETVRGDIDMSHYDEIYKTFEIDDELTYPRLDEEDAQRVTLVLRNIVHEGGYYKFFHVVGIDVHSGKVVSIYIRNNVVDEYVRRIASSDALDQWNLYRALVDNRIPMEWYIDQHGYWMPVSNDERDRLLSKLMRKQKECGHWCNHVRTRTFPDDDVFGSD